MKTVCVCVLGVWGAHLWQDGEEQARCQAAWAPVPPLQSLHPFMIQDNPLNHSVPQFPHPWLYLTYQVHGEEVKFGAGIMTHVDTLWEKYCAI